MARAATNAPARRVQPDQATSGGGDADRACRVTAETAEALVRRHRGSGTARGTTWDIAMSPWIMAGAEERIISADATGPFVQVVLTQQYGTGFF